MSSTPPAVRSTCVRVEVDEFAVYMAGAEDAPTTLVCFHGLGLTAQSWLPFAEQA